MLFRSNENNKKIELLIDDDRSQRIDGTKLLKIANEFGRSVQLGTEKTKLKINLKLPREKEHLRYQITGEVIKKLAKVDRKGKKAM